jgi:hypothetical protein
MAISASTLKRHRPQPQLKQDPKPSMRQVCLIGGLSLPIARMANARVSWEGRAYRIKSIQGQEQAQDPPRATYVHLAPADEE